MRDQIGRIVPGHKPGAAEGPPECSRDINFVPARERLPVPLLGGLPMITIERQSTSKLVALSEDSGILGYTQTDDPRRFYRELGGHRLDQPVRIYEVCPLGTEDVGHYYDFEAKCLMSRNPHAESH
jgi:hypothetical protein